MQAKEENNYFFLFLFCYLKNIFCLRRVKSKRPRLQRNKEGANENIFIDKTSL
jgi:hypothetical protein